MGSLSGQGVPGVEQAGLLSNAAYKLLLFATSLCLLTVLQADKTDHCVLTFNPLHGFRVMPSRAPHWRCRSFSQPRLQPSVEYAADHAASSGQCALTGQHLS